MFNSEGVPNLRILVIDDNPEIHKDFIKILTKNLSSKSDLDELEQQIFNTVSVEDKKLLPQFQIDTASQGQEGMEKVQKAIEELNPYALAFVDIRMPPGWDGIETIKRIWEVDADIQIVICTAYSDYSWEDTVNQLGEKENLLILKKPFDKVAVRQLACALTKKWQLLQDVRNYNTKLKQEVKDQTASLQKSLSLVKATLESSNDGILVINKLGKIVDFNQKLLIMWGITDDALGQDVAEKFYTFMESNIENKEVLERIKALENNIEIILSDTVKLKNGKIFELYTQPQKIADETVGRIFDFRDITKRVKLEKNLEYQATHDSLTGLPNRVLLLEQIKDLVKNYTNTSHLFALLFIDLDRFKIINDSLSHAVGDEVLKIASERLKNSIRSEDTLARLGGDEFVILFPRVKNEVNIAEKLNRLQSVFKEAFTIENRNIIVTASVGISIFPRDGTSADILLRNADAAMYRAKEQHGNSYQFYTKEMNEQSLEKLENEMFLRQALKKNEFFLNYQPQIDIKTGKIIAAEALIRWHHPEKGVLLPLDFIPMAEETGLITKIGNWVLYKACAQNKIWQDKGLIPIRIAVNVTSQQFTHQNLVTIIADILTETKLSPEYLEIELTENVIVSNIEIINALEQLKELGVTIAIDDFGTGYSSLSYLKKIPLDRLKIDKSFIQNIKSTTDDEVIIRAIIAMAKNLNLQVLAEGVENKHQLNFLKVHECEDVQGYFFSKPLSTEDLEDFLRKSVESPIVVEETS